MATLSMLSFRIATSLACATCALASTARADDAPVDKPHVADSSPHAIDRTWLYLTDATVAAPGQVIATTSASFTQTGVNPDPTSPPYRAFSFNTAQPGTLVSLGGEVGLLPRVSLMAVGQAQLGGEGSATWSPGAVVGLRVELSPFTWRDVHLLASGGYLRETWAAPTRDEDTGALNGGEPNGGNGAWAEVVASADIRRVRLGFAAHGEHVFAAGRDTVDVMLQAGASVRLVDWLRAGVEWVGQDLEETVTDQAEGGARHFVGPTLGAQLLQERLTIVAGPSVGLSDASPKLLGRLALSYGF